jgi:hypothetical protein
MPYFAIQTSQPLDDASAAGLAGRASAFAAELLGKPEAYVMTALTPGAVMTFAGSDAPAAFVDVRSIGLPEAHCSEFADAISRFIQTELDIDPGRVFIDMRDLPRTRFAWNGKTFG